jgi:hypothetical protein
VAFAHLSIASMCSDIASAAVATGMGNTLGNKGAVAISMRIGRTRFVFANAHLAAHQNAVKQRNSDYAKISKELPILLYKSEVKSRARAEWRISKNSTSKTRKGNTIVPTSPVQNGEALTSFSVGPSPATPFEDVSNRFDADGLDAPAFSPELDEAAERVIFMGDLNYRIRGNR